MKKPNILFLFPDQHRREWLNYSDDVFKMWEMERPELHLPNIEAIQKKGVTFLNACTPSPLCSPARACVAAGARYNNCGAFNNDYDFPLDKPTFYQSLRNEGYEVCGVGKFDLQKLTCDWENKELPIKLGFTKQLDNEGKMDAIRFTKMRGEPAGPYMKYLNEKGYMQAHLDDMHERKKKTHTTPLPDEVYCDNWITNNAVDMINEVEIGKPWFMQVNFTGPHEPFDITKKMRKSVDTREYEIAVENTDDNNINVRRNYAAMIENIDRNIGILLDLVEKRGELDNTVIVYSSDHGEMLGDYGRYAKGVALRGSLNVPFVVSLPNGKRQGEEDNSFVEIQDLANTFVELAGGKANNTEECKSLLPTLNDEEHENHRDYAVSALFIGKNGFRAYTDYDYKYIETKTGEISLYDLKLDIWEKNNIASTHSALVKDYSAKLNNHVKFTEV